MLQTLTTAAATLLILLACHYLYRASPQQHWPGAPPDPARARRLAWRYALAALLLNTLALGGYGIAVSLAVAMTALGLMPLIPLLPQPRMAILTKFCTRRAAEDGTPLYGEAAQHRTGLCEDCHIYPPNPFPALIHWLNAGEPRPAWLAKIAAATLLGIPACLLLATAHYQWRHHDGETVRYLAMWHGTYLWLALLIATSLAKNGRAACKQHLILLLAAFTLYRLSA